MSSDIILVDKPAGWTSFDVVAKTRGIVRRRYQDQGVKPTKRQLKVGHAGTLDPFATGLLVILLGDATKRAGEFLKLDKTYEATVHLGQVTTTGDPEGELRDVVGPRPTKAQVQEVLNGFIGDVSQLPPAFSAVKIGGVRAYKLAREGKVVDMKSRMVCIHDIQLVSYRYPEIRMTAHVGSGTYIRTLAEDIGRKLGGGAYCSQLRRTTIADWSVTDSSSIDQLETIDI